MKLILCLLFLFVFGSPFAVAQPDSPPQTQEKQLDAFLRQHSERRAKNPEAVSFTVRLKDDQKQFQIGEVITLELSFASSKPEAYRLDAATYDRSGRLHSDGFAVDPRDAVADPLEDYFGQDLGLFMMGGLRSIPDLTDKPYVITEDLNEWQRIDKPGHYRLYVVSSRVGSKKKSGGSFLDTDIRSLISNVIEFDVLPPDEKWAKQELEKSIAVLSKADGDHDAACKTLRYLGTPAAVSEMRKRFTGDDKQCEWEYKFGLIGSPHREVVIRDMENAISLREQPVTSHFIQTLSLLEFTKRAGRAPTPVSDSEEDSKQWRAQMNRRETLQRELRLNYVRQLVMALPEKQGKARATSLQTLLDYRSEFSPREVAAWSSLLGSISEVFSQLRLDEQLRLLQYQWKSIAGPAMLPVLREVMNYSYTSKQDNGGFDIYRQEEIRSMALRRIYELSPDEGRRLILEEARRAKPRVNSDVLRLLPDETLPELNNVLAANLEEKGRSGNGYMDEITELIERYATDEIATRVKTVFESRKLDCRSQAALIAYFLRVAPAEGGEYLNKALAARNKGYPMCYTETLKKVADLHMSKELEETAITALDHDDEEVVAQAATVLGEYGSADAEKALWRRFEKWHEVMQSRSGEPPKKLTDNQGRVEDALLHALIKGQGWFADAEKLKRARDLGVMDRSREEVDQLISNSDPQIFVGLYSTEEEALGVAQYSVKSLDSLKAKLLQFPKGTEFTLRSRSYQDDDPRSKDMFQKIKKLLDDLGIKLKDEPQHEKVKSTVWQ